MPALSYSGIAERCIWQGNQNKFPSNKEASESRRCASEMRSLVIYTDFCFPENLLRNGHLDLFL